MHNSTLLSESSLERERNSPDFRIDDIVEVRRRMWPGINKQGGRAKITGIHYIEGKSNLSYSCLV